MTNHSISRRSLLAMAGAGLATGSFRHALGAELYTVRDVLPGAPEKTLQAIAKIGYTEVETDRLTMVKYAGLFRKVGLKVTACHVETPLITATGNRGKRAQRRRRRNLRPNRLR